jgi:hypothetical protein
MEGLLFDLKKRAAELCYDEEKIIHQQIRRLEDEITKLPKTEFFYKVCSFDFYNDEQRREKWNNVTLEHVIELVSFQGEDDVLGVFTSMELLFEQFPCIAKFVRDKPVDIGDNTSVVAVAQTMVDSFNQDVVAVVRAPFDCIAYDDLADLNDPLIKEVHASYAEAEWTRI